MYCVKRFWFHICCKLSCKNAWIVPEKKQKYSDHNILAMINPYRPGTHSNIKADHIRHIPQYTKDFFLPMMSAKIEVGNSHANIVIVAILDIMII